MQRRTDRRTVLKLLTAAPLGLAASAALSQQARAQTPVPGPVMRICDAYL